MTEENVVPTPVEEGQQPVAVNPDLAAQLELVKGKNAELIAERRKDRERFEELQRQVSEMQQQSQQAKQAKLAETGEFKQLWEDASKTVADLQAALNERDGKINELQQSFQQQQIRASAVNQMTQLGVHAPDQLYKLMGDSLRMKDGAVVALVGGVEVPLQDHLSNLKSPASGYEHFFRASGSVGMGSVAPTASTNSSGQSNPYIARNLTKIVELEATNPELAARLKREAIASRQS